MQIHRHAVVGISIHPPRAGRDCRSSRMRSKLSIFQSTRPVRGGTAYHPGCAPSFPYFNPPAPCGAGRLAAFYQYQKFENFNPPAPCGAGLSIYGYVLRRLYFNPPAPCGAGLQPLPIYFAYLRISIHPPRAGRDVSPIIKPLSVNRFQSTRPVRGGTRGNIPHPCALRFQSTRPVRGGTFPCRFLSRCLIISIHPPRAGRDVEASLFGHKFFVFQSTRPVRGGTKPN